MIRNEAFSLAEDLAAQAGGGGHSGGGKKYTGGGGDSFGDKPDGSGFAAFLTLLLAGLMFGACLCPRVIAAHMIPASSWRR